MESIHEGMTGASVEDIQERLLSLGYEIDEGERKGLLFGKTTAAAVEGFRMEHNLPRGAEVDAATWSVLVDEGYQMGDRTLYLRLPNYHGNDVRQLQSALNILGFSCGEVDGYFDAHTEAAVKQFQENVGLFADGMAFADTFDAIERLHHVWEGKPSQGPHPTGGMGFARAASVLDGTSISLTAEDPISRNVAGRIWNLATATSEGSGIKLVDAAEGASPDDEALLVFATSPVDTGSAVANVVANDNETLPLRIRTACESSTHKPPYVRIELPTGPTSDSAFTVSDAQTLAVMLLDAICAAFS
ncbi:MAG: peptidoglycan-binding protein [Atopobiaceae bacterium]|jgi:peptidoglycan hydrolase-like protein with peptidoglycan-binding domain|nr:peptidoglycan-binding protein [Atopobiaceae bacterium]